MKKSRWLNPLRPMVLSERNTQLTRPDKAVQDVRAFGAASSLGSDFPEFGIHPRLWSRWTVEKRLEVLIHEFAHVHDYEQNHRPPFWDRVVRMVQRAEEAPGDLKQLLGTPIDFHDLKQTVVESVRDDVIDRRMDFAARHCGTHLTFKQRSVARAIPQHLPSSQPVPGPTAVCE